MALYSSIFLKISSYLIQCELIVKIDFIIICLALFVGRLNTGYLRHDLITASAGTIQY